MLGYLSHLSKYNISLYSRFESLHGIFKCKDYKTLKIDYIYDAKSKYKLLFIKFEKDTTSILIQIFFTSFDLEKAWSKVENIEELIINLELSSDNYESMYMTMSESSSTVNSALGAC
ncbi:unnamed protein product [Rhizopus stolonifer]